MRCLQLATAALYSLGAAVAVVGQGALLARHSSDGRSVSVQLFSELEELARVVDISYCVALTDIGIQKPFTCLSRCSDFPAFELLKTWETGLLLGDSCGYIALDHGKGRILVAFRGSYSLTNAIVDLSTIPQDYVPYPGPDRVVNAEQDVFENVGATEGQVPYIYNAPKCNNCTVHMGFQSSWASTRAAILPDLEQQVALYPHYKLHLVGHSLGGAVAALAGLDLQARGWAPTVTTYGEPRAGNKGLVKYIDDRFNLLEHHNDDTKLRYRRVTHVDDPVPLLPLSEWGFAMHAGEIHISKPALSPDLEDVERCEGDNDPDCAAGQDPSVNAKPKNTGLLASIESDLYDVLNEPWGIPSRYKLWNMLSAHRDYFWRLGLCMPGGDPLGGGGKYEWATPGGE